jgi:hypothetical protein
MPAGRGDGGKDSTAIAELRFRNDVVGGDSTTKGLPKSHAARGGETMSPAAFPTMKLLYVRRRI